MFDHYKTDFFFLRTPLYPLEKLKEFYTQLTNSNTDKKEFFKRILTSPAFNEALFLASPDFYQQANRYLEGTITEARQASKIEWSLLKYYTRSCYRCTPFGIFAAGSVGTISDKTAIVIDTRLERHVRLDMSYLYDIMMKLLEEEEVRKKAAFLPNKTIYEVGDKLRYIEVKYESHGVKSHTIAEITRNAVLLSVLKECRHGNTYQALVDHVCALGADAAEATDFINTLIVDQLLVMELEPNVSGNSYLEEMLTTLKVANIDNQITACLQDVQGLSAAIKNEGGLAGYNALLQRITEVHPALQESQVLQVDAFRPCQESLLSTSVTKQIKEILSALSRLGTSGSAGKRVAAFKKAFEQKYDRQPLPLLKALDPELGIDYKKIHPFKDTPTVHQEQVSRYKFRKHTEALLQRQFEITIHPEELVAFENPPLEALPDSLYAIFKLSGAAEAPQISFSVASGPSAANLLGRFCHMHKGLEAAVKELLATEELFHPDKIFAEIVHLPQPRIGNIMARPHLRLYEIPFLARSTRPTAYQLELSDLYIKVENDRVVLFSEKLGKEIVPRLATAHNFSSEHTLAIYNFLCDLQFQGLRTVLGWSWEQLSDEAFLPRVKYQQSIISPATWNVSKEQVLARGPKLTIELFQQELAALQQEQHLPMYVEYGDGDNKLILDISNEQVVTFLHKELELLGKIKLMESIGLEAGSPVMIEGVPYNNEFILPFIKNKAAAERNPADMRRHQLLTDKVARTYIPGSEWIYFKLYTGVRNVDNLLCDKIYPLVKKLKKKGVVSKCFFIRYNDPGFHIRIRFLLNRKEDLPAVMTAVYTAVDKEVKTGKISQVVLDTYQREIERYGEKTMLLSESVFDIDSDCVMSLLKSGVLTGNEDNRMLAGLSGLACYLEGLKLNMEQRQQMCETNFRYLSREYGREDDATMKVELDKKYRFIQKDINDVMDMHQSDKKPVAQIVAAHYAYSNVLLDKVQAITNSNDTGPYVKQLAGSYFHMYINRLFAEKQRQTECELYYYAGKYYGSLIARAKKITGKQVQ
ncbi:lantibiotic dehydratase [Chitinophaga sp. Hz27]|uniref:lantibiotic dehydratase n=1 Tax=Chitinophaga sp. Hz27 TaxID=3347169 RepID=UPI0035DCF5BE